MKKPLIILTGPTAVGKTKLSIQLAKEINGSILSADSMQVYRHMNIGSAKITPAEMEGIPHYLIDEYMPTEAFHVVHFLALAQKYMAEIIDSGRIPIVTGGTGFYIQALLYDVSFTKESGDGTYRQELEALFAQKGSEYLHQMLSEIDPDAALNIHPHNKKRVIRALEYYELTGNKISAHNEQERKKKSPYTFCYFVLNDPREKIYERINDRVDQMIAAGLVTEVKKLLSMGCHAEMISMQGLGYKEIIAHLAGECTLAEAITQIKRDTRHFAKRQLTWFRREKEVIWVNKQEFCDDSDKILAFMKHKIYENGINPSFKLS
jgi:tRNA dimethylallyltransferase